MLCWYIVHGGLVRLPKIALCLALPATKDVLTISWQCIRKAVLANLYPTGFRGCPAKLFSMGNRAVSGALDYQEISLAY